MVLMKEFFYIFCFCLISKFTLAQDDVPPSALSISNRDESRYAAFAGKIIRNISIRQIGFSESLGLNDSSSAIKTSAKKILDVLHTNTQEWVIENNLFIKTGKKLNPYLLADNERYLRTLDFIQDAVVKVQPIKNNNDSVDIEIITKDLFSLTASVDFGDAGRKKFMVGENNLNGAGQKVQVTSLIDSRRKPQYGYGLLYSKNSVQHSFINATLGFTKINYNPQREEALTSAYLQLDRPLVSPYSKIAGGFLFALNKSTNAYQKQPNAYLNYKNTLVDVWAGYNIGVNRLIADNLYRKRTLLALRYFNQHFSQVPVQIGNKFSPYYNSKLGVLAELTLFRQEFYKTNYIYGFGITEDIPFGYNLALTAGFTKHLDLKRPYIGITANRFIVTPKNEFLQGFVRVGGYLNNGGVQDVGLLAGLSYYSKPHQWNDIKVRHYLRFSYTRIANQLTEEPLQINNSLGLQFFNADSLTGKRRISSYGETFMFLKI